MKSLPDNVVLLFYREFERDRFVPYDRYIRRTLRPFYKFLRRDQSVSGFFVWYRNLVVSLRQLGYNVRINDYRLARSHPDHPVGLIGYPHILEGWSLPNPVILGPGMYDHPSLAPDLMKDARFRFYLTTCEWNHDIFAQRYGETCVPWYGGIDTNKWRVTPDSKKSIDVLIYDKIRWNIEHLYSELLYPIVRQLESKSLSYNILRYGRYQHKEYKELLRHSRSMIFLCEHETQGLAYQEALACDVPVLAWDNGYWLDPKRFSYGCGEVRASSVPYFSEECGESFRDLDEFKRKGDVFYNDLMQYTPRQYVERELSMEGRVNYTRGIISP